MINSIDSILIIISQLISFVNTVSTRYYCELAPCTLFVKFVSRRYNGFMNVHQGQDLLERLNNLLRMESRTLGLKFGLQPIQIEALTYLTRCNRYSDTPQAVTEYLGLTKGTVSQSLKVLEQKAFLRKQQDKEDKRITHLTVTAKGKKLVDQAFPDKTLEAAVAKTSSAQGRKLEDTLRSLLREMQHLRDRKTFAACHTCRFHEHYEKGYICGLTKEALSKQDIQLICREHEYPS